MGNRALAWRLRAIRAADAWRWRRLCRSLPGLSAHPEASVHLCRARFHLEAGARLRIGAGVVTEPRADAVRFHLGPGADVEIGDGTWLRGEVAPVHIVAYANARIRIGPDCFLNGCHLSAKRELVLGRRAWVGTGSRIFDADQHDFDAERPERCEPVRLGDHVWVASDVTVLRGVEIGEHSVIGTRSLVTRSVPAHTLAYGVPAEPRGRVGDRSATR